MWLQVVCLSHFSFSLWLTSSAGICVSKKRLGLFVSRLVYFVLQSVFFDGPEFSNLDFRYLRSSSSFLLFVRFRVWLGALGWFGFSFYQFLFWSPLPFIPWFLMDGLRDFQLWILDFSSSLSFPDSYFWFSALFLSFSMLELSMWWRFVIYFVLLAHFFDFEDMYLDIFFLNLNYTLALHPPLSSLILCFCLVFPHLGINRMMSFRFLFSALGTDLRTWRHVPRNPLITFFVFHF